MNTLNLTNLTADNLKQLNCLPKDLHNSCRYYQENINDLKINFLKEKFKHTISQRVVMITAIKKLFKANKTQPANSNSITSALPKLAISLKSLFNSKNGFVAKSIYLLNC